MDDVDNGMKEVSETATDAAGCGGVPDHASQEVTPAAAADIIGDIYAKYNKGLFRFLKRRLDSQDDVEDMAQEVYLRLARHRRPDDIRPSLALLCTIASNLLKDRYRRLKVRKLHAHVPASEADVEASGTSPEDIAKSKEGLAYFQAVYRSLSKECRQAFMLHRFKGYTYEEIARELGISKSMVQKHISHVLFQLGKKFESFI